MAPAGGSRLLRRYAAGHPHAVVCFHHAGGGMSAYRSWARPLRARADLLLVQLKGREDRVSEPLTDRLDEIAVELARQLEELPYDELVLLGHSMGATVAWAVADALWSVYRRRVRLVMSAQAPPPYDPADLPASVAEAVGPPARVPNGSPAGIPAGDPTAADEFHAEILAADLAWMTREFPAVVPRVLPVDLHCVSASRDHLLPPGAMAAWAALTTGRFAHRTVDGAHMYLLDDPAPLLTLVSGLADTGPTTEGEGDAP